MERPLLPQMPAQSTAECEGRGLGDVKLLLIRKNAISPCVVGHISVEHRQRKKHRKINSDTDATYEKKRQTIFSKKKRNGKMKKEMKNVKAEHHS